MMWVMIGIELLAFIALALLLYYGVYSFVKSHFEAQERKKGGDDK